MSTRKKYNTGQISAKKKTFMRRSKVLVLIMLLISGVESRSQINGTVVRSEMNAINRRYDSAFYLTFDIKMIYQSDAASQGQQSISDTAENTTNSEITGTYTFSGNKALYKLGTIEYLQNERYTIALYNDNKFILVGKPVPGQRPGMLIPTRALTDSMMTTLESAFTLSSTIDSAANTKTIVFTAIDSAAIYEKIEVEYDLNSHYLARIQYRLKDNQDDNSDEQPTRLLGPQAMIKRADLIFLFQHYRVEQTSPAAFDENNYLFFDGPNEIKPASAYKEYTIYKNY
jgi:hypothetical protein